MNLACCTWALSGDEKAILDQIADVGFDRIDIQPGAFQSPQSNQHLQHLGMTVSCVGLSFGTPPSVVFNKHTSFRAWMIPCPALIAMATLWQS